MPAAALLTGAVEAFQLRASARNGALHCRLAAADPVVLADQVHLVNIVANLLDNALKYGGGDDGGNLAVRCARDDGGVVLSVRDHGAGLGSAQLQTMFEPFFRGEDELTRTQKGTGLGLALARVIARAHGGELTVESTPGDTRFTLRLPA